MSNKVFRSSYILMGDNISMVFVSHRLSRPSKVELVMPIGEYILTIGDLAAFNDDWVADAELPTSDDFEAVSSLNQGCDF